MQWYESNMCSFAEVLSKTAKNDKKPYLYHTGIDMVWAKMSRASLKHHPPPYGQCPNRGDANLAGASLREY